MNGIPEHVITDNGGQFCAAVIEGVYKAFGTKHKTTTSYHPQSNGQVERYNLTLMRMLAKILVDVGKANWDQFVPILVMNYNAAPSSVTGLPPFFVHCGRPMRLPTQTIYADAALRLYADEPNYLTRLMRTVQDSYLAVQHSLQDAQQKMAKQYNKRAHGSKFHIGDRVWNYKKSKGKGKNYKICCNYLGPYVVVEVPNAQTVKIRRIDKPEPDIQTVSNQHVSLVTPEIPWNRVFQGSAIDFIDGRYVISPDELPPGQRTRAKATVEHLERLWEASRA